MKVISCLKPAVHKSFRKTMAAMALYGLAALLCTTTAILSVSPIAYAGVGATASNTISFEAKDVDGKKTWLPPISTVKAGKIVTLTVHNGLTAPHGFKIDGFVTEQVIAPGETKTFTFTPKTNGKLKAICHLHPAHISAEIDVQ